MNETRRGGWDLRGRGKRGGDGRSTRGMGRGGGKKDGSPEGTRDNLLQVPHSTRRQCGGVTPFPFFLPFLFGMFLCEACLPFFPVW